MGAAAPLAVAGRHLDRTGSATGPVHAVRESGPGVPHGAGRSLDRPIPERMLGAERDRLGWAGFGRSDGPCRYGRAVRLAVVALGRQGDGRPRRPADPRRQPPLDVNGRRRSRPPRSVRRPERSPAVAARTVDREGVVVDRSGTIRLRSSGGDGRVGARAVPGRGVLPRPHRFRPTFEPGTELASRGCGRAVDGAVRITVMPVLCADGAVQPLPGRPVPVRGPHGDCAFVARSTPSVETVPGWVTVEVEPRHVPPLSVSPAPALCVAAARVDATP
jgi:hypothetical protein